MGKRSNLLREYRELRQRYLEGDESVLERLESLSIVLNINDNFCNDWSDDVCSYISLY